MSMIVTSTLVRGAVVAVLVACCLTPVLAQRGKWWEDERFKSKLSLTRDQSTHLEAVFQKTLPHLRQHMRALNQR